jgi:hypothetical protein
VDDMAIEREIESITIAFEEPYGLYGESVVKETVGTKQNDWDVIKIEVSTAIFIHSEYLGSSIVDVIPFHQIKNCAAILKCEEN